VSTFTPIRWEAGRLVLLDQRRLPSEETWVSCSDEHDVARAIVDMVVRGAPAIGIAAAFGLVLAARRGADVEAAADLLRATRPTAVNLAWALAEMLAGERHADALEARADAIWNDDLDRCLRMGAHGAELIPDGATVLTHCNAGALATGGHGTALGVIRSAIAAGKKIRVFADETRPWMQGSRLTAWELAKDGIDVTLIPDVAAPHLMACGEITCAIVGADRIARNGDTANKIGTLGVALGAASAGLPFYVAAPLSTIDLATESGKDIPIEERKASEVTELFGTRTAPAGIAVRNPAFDVTPARLITAIITEIGILRPPWENFAATIRAASRPTGRSERS
jgi:methylthioribose-1-phosphate isomerase